MRSLEIEAVFWNRCYESDRIKKDTKLKNYLLRNNIRLSHLMALYYGSLGKIKNKSGNPYKVFTPFFKSGCLENTVPRLPIIKPKNLSFKKIKTS